MKKILKKVLLATAVTTLIGANTVFADSVLTSNASITFVANTDPTDPVDPDNPEEPLDPDNPDEPGTGDPGPLSIDYLPQIMFGTSVSLSQKAQIYNTSSSRPFVQITDLRGTGSGWKLTAAMSPFTGKDDKQTLAGATLTLKNGTPHSVNTNNPPVAAQNVVLTSDNEPMRVLTAAADHGMGTWVNRWYPTGGQDDVQLSVAAGTGHIGANIATIEWTLADAP